MSQKELRQLWLLLSEEHKRAAGDVIAVNVSSQLTGYTIPIMTPHKKLKTIGCNSHLNVLDSRSRAVVDLPAEALSRKQWSAQRLQPSIDHFKTVKT